MMRPHRNHPAYWAFLVHRISGIGLALFLPLHFWTLGTALGGEVALDGALAWTDNPLVKFGEWLLVLGLAAHFTGGLRLLVGELWLWSERQRTWIALAGGLSLAASLAFALNVVGGT